MFCPKCGKEFNEGRFCGACGACLVSDSQAVFQNVIEPEQKNDIKPGRVKSKRKKKRIITIVVFAVIALALTLFINLKYPSHPMEAARMYIRAWATGDIKKIARSYGVDYRASLIYHPYLNSSLGDTAYHLSRREREDEIYRQLYDYYESELEYHIMWDEYKDTNNYSALEKAFKKVDDLESLKKYIAVWYKSVEELDNESRYGENFSVRVLGYKIDKCDWDEADESRYERWREYQEDNGTVFVYDTDDIRGLYKVRCSVRYRGQKHEVTNDYYDVWVLKTTKGWFVYEAMA